MKNNIGPHIKKYLNEKGITQAFLSRKTGISEDVISRILNGNRNMSAEEYFLICEALNAPLNVFYKKGGA